MRLLADPTAAHAPDTFTPSDGADVDPFDDEQSVSVHVVGVVTALGDSFAGGDLGDLRDHRAALRVAFAWFVLIRSRI